SERLASALIMHLTYPAFVVDLRMQLHCTNAAGQRLLDEGKLLKSCNQALTCVDAAADPKLRQAIVGLLEGGEKSDEPVQTVELDTEPTAFAFACVCPLPDSNAGELAIVIVPQLDSAAAAKRLASLFSLTNMEERIVASTLDGHAPRRVGAILNLTEATVRTYTKRVMFKLGIKRRSDLFRFAFLTS